MIDKNELLHMLDQAIELVRKEPGYAAPFAFHLTHLEAMRVALAQQPQGETKPVAWIEGEESARHVGLQTMLRNGMMYSTRWHWDVAPQTGNPVWPIYAAPPVEAMKRIAGDSAQQAETVRCKCCGYLVTESEHRGCLRAAAPAPASPAEYIKQLEKETSFAKTTLEATREAASGRNKGAAPAALTEDARFTLQCAVENLRSVDRNADAAFRIASKIESLLAASPAPAQGTQEDARDAARYRVFRESPSFALTMGQFSTPGIIDALCDAAMSASKEGA